MLSAQYRLMIRTERTKAEERGKYDETSIDPYTDEQIARDRRGATRAETARRRGAEPRWWEDVDEGDEIGPLVKGPLRVTDMVCWHVGMGMGLYGVKALRLGYEQRQRVPALLPSRRPERPRRAAARALGSRVGAPGGQPDDATTTAACARRG